MRALRLVHILDHLRARRHPVTAAALADAFAVSVRTIYRDIASLQALGVPVRGEAGLGYSLEGRYFLPPLAFTGEELDAVVFGLRLVGARGDADLAAAAGGALGKLRHILSTEQEEHTHRLPLLAVAVAPATLTGRLRHAVRARQVLHLSYLALDGRSSRRTVWPLGLTAFESVWLLTAWCEAREDFRNFRIDRIAGVEEAGRVFRDQPGRRFADYLKAL